jgi:hypothetical protein
MSKKIFVLFPDGVGLRNFAFTNFKEIGEDSGFEVVYWNNSIFPLKDKLGYDEVVIENRSIHPKTGTLNRARKRVELALSKKRFNDNVYPTYRFPLSFKTLKATLKSLFVKYHEVTHATPKGWQRLMDKMYSAERSTQRYKDCKAQLEEYQPDLVFCTTQRSKQAIAPMLAAQDLDIPTVCWVYSWDNVPKGMSTIGADYYIVWSQLMKDELLKYYPKTNPNQITITGTPQFEPHYDTKLLQTRDQFFSDHNLDIDKRYICFSGDDETTSPLDQYYLEDVAKAVRKLNREGYNLGIIFRKVPVDFSGRYDEVLKNYSNEIIAIDPLWEPMGNQWNTVMPTKEDFKLLVNTCHHSDLVVNICSSMVFDFAIHNKPCIYPNYEQPQLKKGVRDIGQNYNYVHFRTMPEDAVVWALNKAEIYKGIKSVLDGTVNPTSIAKEWFKVINQHPCNMASERIWEALKDFT